MADTLVLLAGTFAWQACLSGRGTVDIGLAGCCRDIAGGGAAEPSSSNGDTSGMPSGDAGHRVWVDVDRAQAALRWVAAAETPFNSCRCAHFEQRGQACVHLSLYGWRQTEVGDSWENGSSDTCLADSEAA